MSQVRDFTTSLCLVTASESKMSLVAVMPPKEFLSKMYPDEAESGISGPNAGNQNYLGTLNNRKNREERRLLKKVAQIILEEAQQRNLEAAEQNQQQQNAHQMGPEEVLEEEVDPYLDQVHEEQQQRQPLYSQTEEPYLSDDYEVRNIFESGTAMSHMQDF